jgi:general stress protein 26
MVDRAKLYHLFENQAHGVLSSTGPDGQPQSAFVGFTQTPRSEDGRFKLVIGTHIGSRKVGNIENNHQVSYVITSESEKLTIQIEGTAKLIKPEDLGEYRQLILDKNPATAHFIDNPERVYIVITPTWIRYTDVSVFPWAVEEESTT